MLGNIYRGGLEFSCSEISQLVGIDLSQGKVLSAFVKRAVWIVEDIAR
jgi:hypothetical protein